jgi:hypothetical protein
MLRDAISLMGNSFCKDREDVALVPEGRCMSLRLSATSVHVQVESDKDPCSLSNDRTILLDTHCCNRAASLHLVGEQKGTEAMQSMTSHQRHIEGDK